VSVRRSSAWEAVLMKLDLYGASSVTDEALQAVAELKALTLLNLGGYPLSTDEGVQAVAELKALALPP